MSMSVPPAPASPTPQRFIEFLTQAEDGRLAVQASEQLADLVKQLKSRVANAGPKHKAKLTVTIDINVDGTVIEISGDVAVKLPKLRRQKSIMYFTKDDSFSPVNQRQQEFDFRDAAAGERREPRDLGADIPARDIRALK